MQTTVTSMLKIERHQRGIDYGYEATVVAAVFSTEPVQKPWHLVPNRSDRELADGDVGVFSKQEQSDVAKMFMRYPCIALLVWVPSHHAWGGVVQGSYRSDPELAVARHNGEYLLMSNAVIVSGERRSRSLLVEYTDRIANAIGIAPAAVSFLHTTDTALFLK